MCAIRFTLKICSTGSQEEKRVSEPRDLLDCMKPTLEKVFFGTANPFWSKFLN